MARKPKATPVEGVEFTNKAGETVLLFKCTMPLSGAEHEILADRVRLEQERSGIKIILVPFMVESEVSHESVTNNPSADDPAAGSKADPELEPDPNGEGDA